MVKIREFTFDDAPAVVGIRNRIQPEPITVEQFNAWRKADSERPDCVSCQFVAEDESGRVVGSAGLYYSSDNPPGLFNAGVSVLPEDRRQGVGQALIGVIEPLARQHGAQALRAWCRGEDQASRAWAEKRGFVVDRVRTESVLDLDGWDRTRFAADLERVRSSGIQLVTVQGMPESEEILRGIWTLGGETIKDIPGFEDQMEPYETWLRAFAGGASNRVVALALDQGRVVGVSIIRLRPGEGGNTEYTGVLREYRGRGVALAVKLLTIDAAVAAGVPAIRTNNDSDNPPMLRVNEKLGYRMVPGPLRLKKVLA